MWLGSPIKQRFAIAGMTMEMLEIFSSAFFSLLWVKKKDHFLLAYHSDARLDKTLRVLEAGTTLWTACYCMLWYLLLGRNAAKDPLSFRFMIVACVTPVPRLMPVFMGSLWIYHTCHISSAGLSSFHSESVSSHPRVNRGQRYAPVYVM